MLRVTLRLPRLAPWRLWGMLVVLSALAGGGFGYFLRLDLPRVEALEDYTPPLATRLYARDGSLLASFAEEQRVYLPYEQIPEVFRKAVVAAEDARFFQHAGLDLRGIARALWRDVREMRLAEGASTITQQLARGLFLHPRKLWRRKLQEIFLAIEIERRYSKEEILALYCNQVYTGHGRYGVEAAARFYFGKPARELTLPEAALLAGVLRRPESYSPLRDPERSLARRNYVLSRMEELGFVTREQAEAARRQPLQLAARQPGRQLAPYFVEEVRRMLQARLGEASVYRAGLEVRTTLDPQLQTAAERAIEWGLRRLDKRRGWRGVQARVPQGADPETWEAPRWQHGIAAGLVLPAVVLGSLEGGAVEVRLGPYRGRLEAEDVRWTGKGRPASFLERGDVVEVLVEQVEAAGGVELELDQEPAVEGALLALDPRTGEVLALVGGLDFARSEFDRAIQARRQAGSAFKPLVYAAALAAGWTPSDRLLDEPTVFLDPLTLDRYQPENFDDHYHGLVTLRTALEKSLNIATVKLLGEIGYEGVIGMARRLGIASPLRAYPSLALGAFEVSLLELASAFATFANQGVRVAPHLVQEVRRPDGSLMERTQAEVRDALAPEIAYLMTRLLQGVIAEGTGRAAADLGLPLAGKTGTTDQYTDAWFLGYGPDLVVGVWVGLDMKQTLGARETGASAALPIWRQVMESYYGEHAMPEFPRPPGIVEVAVDRETGLRADPAAGCRRVFVEVFLAGTEPTAFCTAAEHARLQLPYPFHRYPLDEEGRLVAPARVLTALAKREPLVEYDAARSVLVTSGPAGRVELPLHLEAEDPPPVLSGRLLERLAQRQIFPEAWVGRDGRPAAIQLWQNPR